MAQQEHPTRIILRLRVCDFDENGHQWEDHHHAVKVYLQWAARESEPEDRHVYRAQPFQPIEVQQRSFYVVLDLDHAKFHNPNMDSVHHEVYAVRRDEEGKLTVKQAKDEKYAKNLILKLRQYTDSRYPWGSAAVNMEG